MDPSLCVILLQIYQFRKVLREKLDRLCRIPATGSGQWKIFPGWQPASGDSPLLWQPCVETVYYPAKCRGTRAFLPGGSRWIAVSATASKDSIAIDRGGNHWPGLDRQKSFRTIPGKV